MKNCPDRVEKQSRRTFTKHIATALVTMPFTYSPISAKEVDTSNHVPTTAQPNLAPVPLPLVLEHLPPVTFRGGSLEVESRLELTRTNVGGRRPYRYTPNLGDDDLNDPTEPEPDLYGRIMRVRVTDDFGLERYYDETATGEWKIEIFLQKVLNEKNKPDYQSIADIPEEQIVLVQGGFFELFTSEKFSTEGEKQYKRLKRHKKYKRDKFGGKRVRIGKVRITKPATPAFDVPGDPTNGYQIFITFDDDVRGLIPPAGQRCRRLKKC